MVLSSPRGPIARRRSQSSAADIADTLPDAVAEEVRLAYRVMGCGRVAIRSSATAEDGAGASMAGQYETFLDVQGDSGLLDAVRQCWASLDAPRALAYLREHEIDPSCVAMAVVVQRLVPADVAGVLFTTNPHDGSHSEMLVEAGLGIGRFGRLRPGPARCHPRGSGDRAGAGGHHLRPSAVAIWRPKRKLLWEVPWPACYLGRCIRAALDLRCYTKTSR